MGSGLTRNFFWKIIPIIPKPVLIFGVVYHVNYVCIYSTLLKVASYYDLSVLSMSVMGFHKKVWMGVGGWGELYPNLFWIFGNFLTLQRP